MVTAFVAGVFTVTSPKEMLVTLVLSAGTGTVNAKTKVSVTLPAVAVRVTVCAVETGVTFAVNWAVVLLVCTSAAGDIVTAALLFDRATLKPGETAGALIVTVHRSVPVPPIDALAQVMPVSCGAAVCASATPAPSSGRQIPEKNVRTNPREKRGEPGNLARSPLYLTCWGALIGITRLSNTNVIFLTNNGNMGGFSTLRTVIAAGSKEPLPSLYRGSYFDCTGYL
jgi:hypothetical protein